MSHAEHHHTSEDHGQSSHAHTEDTHTDAHGHSEDHGTHHTAESHGVEHATHHVSAKTVEALGIGTEVHPSKLGPIALIAKTTRDIGAILDAGVLKYFEGIGQAVSTSYHNLGNTPTTGKFLKESGNSLVRLGDATIGGIVRSVQGMYNESKNLIAHLSAGTVDWLGNPGRMFGNALKTVWNLPTTIYETLSKKSTSKEHHVEEVVHAHH